MRTDLVPAMQRSSEWQNFALRGRQLRGQLCIAINRLYLTCSQVSRSAHVSVLRGQLTTMALQCRPLSSDG